MLAFFRPQTLAQRALLFILLINLAMMAIYIGIDYQYVFHSDAAAANLLAQEMRETGNFFPPDWNYVNNDLWLLCMQLWVVPLVGLFPNGYPLHMVVSVGSAAMVLWGTWLLGAVAGLSRTARLATLALFAAGISPNMVENLYGQAAYGTIYYSVCLVLYGSWRFLQHGQRARLWGGVALLVALTLFWANPQRAAVYCGVPLGAGALMLLLHGRLQPRDGLPQRRTLLLLLALLGTAVAGALLHRYTVSQVNVTAGVSAAQWLSYEAMLQNLLGTLRGLFSLLCGLPPAGGQVLSGWGAAHALRLLAALAMLVVLPWAAQRCLRWQHPGRLFLASGALCALGICLLINITTTIPVVATPEASIRYVLPPLLCLLVLAVGVLLDQRDGVQALRLAGIGALVVMLGSAMLSYNVPEAGSYWQHSQKYRDSYKWHQIAFLREHGLEYGYSNFWNAGESTVLSGGKLRARQITIEGGLPVPHRHLASDRWYLPEAWQGPTYLMLTPEEAAAIDWPRLNALTGAPRQRLGLGSWQILVYDHNIAADLPAWDPAARKPVHYPASATTPHQAGRFNPASGAVETAAGEGGFMMFGQNTRLQPGRYQVSFDVDASGDGNAFAQMDVTSDFGRTTHATGSVSRTGRQHVVLLFELQRRASAMEFRLSSTGAGALKLYNVELTRVTAPPLAAHHTP